MADGYLLPPRDTLHVLMVFAEVDYSKNCPGNLGSPWNVSWPEENGLLLPPTHASNLLSPFAHSSPEGKATMYYREASFGNYMLLGDFLPKAVRIPCSSLRPRSYGIDQVLDTLAAWFGLDSLQSAAGLPAHVFDRWTLTEAGLPKIKAPDGKVDLLYVVWKNNRYLHGMHTLDHSGYGVTPFRGKPFGPFVGLNTAASFNQSQGLGHSLHVTVCEHLHALFGGNNWHSGGGAGMHTFFAIPANYGLTGQMNSPMIAFSAWDRWMMQWKNPQKKFITSALDSLGQEVPTDNLRGDQGPNREVFYLRNFRTTGDALRIKLPHLNYQNKGDVKNQYLWIEYRLLDHESEEYLSPKHDCNYRENEFFRQGTPGAYAYIQVGKDQQRGNMDLYNARPELPNGLGSFIFPLPADGRWDYRFRPDKEAKPHYGACCWNNRSIPVDYTSSLSNPFTGLHDLFLTYDTNKDGRIWGGDPAQPGLAEWIPDTILWNQRSSGDSQDAFGARTGYTELSLSTNPAPVPVYTHATHFEGQYAGPPNASFENRIIHLNGLRIQFFEDTMAQHMKVVVERNVYQINNNVRWCGIIHLHPRHDSLNLPSLLVPNKRNLRLAKSTSPTMARAPEKSTDLTGATELHLLPGSKLKVQGKGKIILEKGTTLVQHPGSILEVPAPQKIKWLKRGQLVILESNK